MFESFHEKHSVIEAKKNEIKEKKLYEFYGDEKSNEVMDAYSTISSNLSELAELLFETKVPKYVHLAKLLREYARKPNVELLKAQVLLKDSDNKYGMNEKQIMTTYKEFKQIERRAKRTSKKHFRMLKRYKDVETFIRRDANVLMNKIRQYAQKDSYFSKEIKTLPSEPFFIEFLEHCEELSFLNTSKLTKKVR